MFTELVVAHNGKKYYRQIIFYPEHKTQQNVSNNIYTISYVYELSQTRLHKGLSCKFDYYKQDVTRMLAINVSILNLIVARLEQFRSAQLRIQRE